MSAASLHAEPRFAWTRLLIYTALILLAVLFLAPLAVVVLNSLRSGQRSSPPR